MVPPVICVVGVVGAARLGAVPRARARRARGLAAGRAGPVTYARKKP